MGKYSIELATAAIIGSYGVYLELHTLKLV